MATLVNYSLTGGNGDTIVLDYSNYVLTGLTGQNIPSTKVRIDESAGAGGTWRNTKRGIRDISMSITVIGSSRSDVESKLRRLARLTQDANGATVVSAIYDDASELTLDCHYATGAEGVWGGDVTGLIWCSWVLSFQAPQPYWQSADVESFSVTSGNTGRGLLPQLTKLRVSSSQALGVVTVNNTGDVEAYPIWNILGPVEDLVISNGTQSFGLNVAVAAGETITVNTETGTVIDDIGANRYANLNPAPKLFSLLPGITSVSVNGINADANTRITCSYALRYEVIH